MFQMSLSRSFIALVLFALAGQAVAAVGETHRTTTTPTAALRNADGSPKVAITVWYPAKEGAHETLRVIGPDNAPLFKTGSAADDAPPAQGRYPVVLLSHGFGGTARMMAWFGTALARTGIVVIAVDHPGSNGRGLITGNGAAWWWERAEDLKAAWNTIQADPELSPHIDAKRLGVAGFSAGGFAALVAGGARVDVQHFADFCQKHPNDGVCAPQLEAPDLTARDIGKWLKDPAMQARFKDAAADHAIPGVRAVFVMAPAIVQAIAPDSLRRMQVPVSILVGTADTVAPPATNADVVAQLVPGATEQRLAGATHYDFLGDCQPPAKKAVPQCAQANHQAQAHEAALAAAIKVFQQAWH
ncbi:alpha/beta hydrolase family protein [Luteibacter aegosomatissinici]|uniref:alpha/beta hydrolase family protein n=1 Tax=Luteibacter aegosomatissinici TaxID=2911539 RepID=UPI001FF8D9EA|nr:alpha/beta hydrolase [Luteibacter aegosomatissinici]UPG93869.1 alpha/beta hydrolase [Luteibacter aegosomatissinici]